MVGRSVKSYQYYYCTCNRICKQGREACNSRILPKEKIERLVIEQIKSKILDEKYLEELVRLVNIELDDGLSLIKEKMANVDKEIREVENRLSRLYDALESGKLDLHDLAPGIKELLAKQGELHKTRVVAEAEMILQGYQQVNVDTVRSYAMDLRDLLDKS
jgi:site-specific DNA recombinase